MVKNATSNPFAEPVPDVVAFQDPNPWNRPETVALALAVLHHGLSNLAERSIPPRAETIVDTATKFQKHLRGETLDPFVPNRH